MALRRIFILFLALVSIYSISVIFRAKSLEKKVEQFSLKMIHDIAKPWSGNKIRVYGSDWLNKVSEMTPERFSELAINDPGSLVKINKGPNCKIQTGYRKGEVGENVWAICSVNARFEKTDGGINFRLGSKAKLAEIETSADSLRLEEIEVLLTN